MEGVADVLEIRRKGKGGDDHQVHGKPIVARAIGRLSVVALPQFESATLIEADASAAQFVNGVFHFQYHRLGCLSVKECQ